jgi:hypothetical protein
LGEYKATNIPATFVLFMLCKFDPGISTVRFVGANWTTVGPGDDQVVSTHGGLAAIAGTGRKGLMTSDVSGLLSLMAFRLRGFRVKITHGPVG